MEGTSGENLYSYGASVFAGFNMFNVILKAEYMQRTFELPGDTITDRGFYVQSGYVVHLSGFSPFYLIRPIFQVDWLKTSDAEKLRYAFGFNFMPIKYIQIKFSILNQLISLTQIMDSC